ncbi:WD40 repeat domain-containing protein [Botrimarina hoheduenensis]|uniref:WD40 repeat domain-containing protein n=1 Tax=Botrimarina hoheduenensis TaxID=2528000 RepID=UPI0011B76F2E|nr:WD40 repeat domain-containing protein [Botrimarina hoheduenensis]
MPKALILLSRQSVALAVCLLAVGNEATAERTCSARLTLQLPTVDGAHHAVPTGLSISPRGGLIAAGCDDHLVRLWDAQTGQQVGQIAAHRDWVRATRFSSDGQMLASVGADHALRLWTVSGAGEPLLVRHGGGPLQAVAFYPNKNRLATVGFGDKLRLIDLDSGDELASYGCACEDTRTVAISPDGRWIAAAGRNGTVRLWDLEDSGGPRDLPSDGRRIRSVAFAPNAPVLATGGDGPAVRLWRLDAVALSQPGGPTPEELLIRPGKAHAVAFVTDDLLAVGGTGNTITVWDVGRVSPLAVLTGHTGTIASLAVSADGRTLVSAAFDTTVRVWNTDPLTGAAATAAKPTAEVRR